MGWPVRSSLSIKVEASNRQSPLNPTYAAALRFGQRGCVVNSECTTELRTSKQPSRAQTQCTKGGKDKAVCVVFTPPSQEMARNGWDSCDASGTQQPWSSSVPRFFTNTPVPCTQLVRTQQEETDI
jgi:hypothetical protein